MTTYGFHYFPDDTHYRAADAQAWLPELRALGARWLTLVGSLSRAVPEPFISALKQAEIEPIVSIPASPIHAIEPDQLMPLFETYARWGVRYVCVFGEPNMRAMWAATAWGKTGLIDRFLEVMTPLWQAQASAGLEPVFPPLAAGGDYWDTAFLEAALAGLARRKLHELMQRLTFAVNLWTFNRPADWGRGGLQSWPQAKPYLTPPGSQDQRGFHLFDWYNEIIQARVGQRRPLLCLAGGPRFGDQTDPALPAVDEVRHASCTHAIVQMLNDNRLPENLLNVNFWMLAAPEGSPFASQAWYRPDGTTLAPVETLKRRTIASKAAMQTKSLKFEARPNGKALRHYLLLPTFEWGVSEWHWEMALGYVRQHRPVCGFSPEEAQQAQRVTIFGNEQGIGRQVEETLRRAGCEVERVTSAE